MSDFPDVAALALHDQEWAAQAACAQTDPEAFFPEKGQSPRAAKAVCDRCDVRAECLLYALDHDERFGVWGGTTEKQRRDLRQHRETTAA